MRAWWLVIALAACGGDNQDPCGYHEADDPGNATTAEATGLAIGAHDGRVCGTIDDGHYDPRVSEIDADTYRVTASSGELLVELAADPGVEVLDDFSVRLFAGTPRVLVAEGSLRPDLAAHAAYVATVPPGDVDLVAVAHAPNALSGTIGYRVHLLADPSASCPAATGRPRYREAHDGAGTDNDVVAADFSNDSPFAMLPGKPEPTGVTIDGGLRYLFAGTAGGESRGDGYLDRDTYALATGDSVNELTVRVDWDGASGADLDFVVFEAGTLQPVVTSTRSGATGSELQVFAVHANASYWLWVGRALAAGAPDATDYRVTICGGNYY